MKKNLLTSAIILTMPIVGFAITLPEVSSVVGSTTAGRVEQNLPKAPQSTTATTGGKIEEKEKPAAQAASAKITFVLTKVIITGNTVFKTAELEKYFQPSYNKRISLADFQNLVDKVTSKYRNKGYVLSRAIIPPQTVHLGQFKIQVIEGYVSKVQVKGGKSCHLKHLVYAMGWPILLSRPLQIRRLERIILIANDIPGVNAQAVLYPSKDIPASADLTIVLDKKRMSGYVTYDNFGTRYLGPQEITLGGNLYSFFAPGDNNTFRFATTTRGRQMHYWEYDYSIPVSTCGTRFIMGSNYTVTQPGFVLEPLYVKGRALSAYADLLHPILRSRKRNLYVHAMFNVQNVMSTILMQPFYNDLIRSVIVGGSFDMIDRWQGADGITLSSEHGMLALGAQDHVNKSRFFGKPQFTKINLAASRLKAYNQQISLLIAFRGQYSCEPLLASEQFGFGGPDFGRGYDPSEILGDHGVAGKIELRFDTVPDKPILKTIQFYGFYDAGIVWNKDGVTQFPKQSATSIGAGMRITFIPQVTANFLIAEPLTHNVATAQILDPNNGQAPRGFFQLAANFG